jgi:micrococcal nuclease
LVDAGHAEVEDFTNNEFEPSTWWENETSNYMFEAATVKGVGYKNVEKLILTPSAPTSTLSGKFVGSTKSDKYHYPSCRWAKKILPENQIWFASSEEARAAGYVPCGVCNPP